MTTKLSMTLLRLWHAWLAGGFLVAWLTADEDTYAMHQFAGYAVLAALALRLLAGMLAPAGSPWRLPRPLKAARDWYAAGRGRNPLFPAIAWAVLAVVLAAAVTGALADVVIWLEDPHEALSEAALWPVFGHVAFVLFMFGGRRLLNRLRDTLRGDILAKESVR